MKQIALIILLATLMAGCENKTKDANSTTAGNEKSAVVYTVDELFLNAADLAGKEITVKGTVMHVCKQGGGRCFLMGSNEDFNIRVEAGEKIGAFSQEQMGSDLTIKGIFREVKTEADAHNPAREHATGDQEHDTEAEEAHQIIVQAQEKVETVYFMEGFEILKEDI